MVALLALDRAARARQLVDTSKFDYVSRVCCLVKNMHFVMIILYDMYTEEEKNHWLSGETKKGR